MSRPWQIKSHSGFDESVTTALGIDRWIGRILYQRGLRTPEEISVWMTPSLKHVHDPDLLPNIDEAAKRLSRAIRDGECILIYGDYDVDGITGSTTLYKIITHLGGNARVYIPNRFKDGYGINEVSLARIYEEDPFDVAVSVDNGVTAFGAADWLQQNNIPFIIADHHTMDESGRLPEGIVVHPALPGSAYPNHYLCGAGVAYKLGWAVIREYTGKRKFEPHTRTFMLDLMCLTAMGTVADVMSLTGENRSLVDYGIRRIEHVVGGVGALARIDTDTFPLKASDIGFRLAPKINAAGRLGEGHRAFQLLIEEDWDKAMKMARHLAEENDRRKAIEKEMAEEADRIIEKMDLTDKCSIVVCGEDWHEGVVGIVASRVVEKYGYPAIILAGHGDGGVKGSGRTCEGVDLKEALDQCKEVLGKYGGHAEAVGLGLKVEDLPRFRTMFDDAVREQLGGNEVGQPTLYIDIELPLPALSENFIDCIEKIGPFGKGNPRPIFCSTVTLADKPRVIGKTGEHLAFGAEQNGRIFRCIMWRGASKFYEPLLAMCGGPLPLMRIAYKPEINVYRDNRSVQLTIQDIKFAEEEQ